MTAFTLSRLAHGARSIAGILRDANGGFLCATLEPAWHAPKIAGCTCIPAGLYPLRLHGWSKFDHVYAARLGKVYRGMIEIAGVTGFSGVLLHCGNTVADTVGCVLAGLRTIEKDGDYIIPAGESVPAMRAMYPVLLAAIRAGGARLQAIDPTN